MTMLGDTHVSWLSAPVTHEEGAVAPQLTASSWLTSADAWNVGLWQMGLLNRMNKLAPPNPAVWPSGFEVQFYTNVTGSDVQDPGAWPPGALKGTLWFGDKRGQRILHAAGSTECMKFYHTDKECSLVFNKLGLFAILPPQELGSEGVQVPAEPRCCLDMPGLLSPAADWVTVAAHEWFMTKHIRGRLCHGNHP